MCYRIRDKSISLPQANLPGYRVVVGIAIRRSDFDLLFFIGYIRHSEVINNDKKALNGIYREQGSGHTSLTPGSQSQSSYFRTFDYTILELVLIVTYASRFLNPSPLGPRIQGSRANGNLRPILSIRRPSVGSK